MVTEQENPKVSPAAPVTADYESTPLSRAEYIAAVVHLYRGELHRANAWRIRLDNTTNWAVLTTAGLLTFTFGESGHSHWALLVGMAMISAFLAFEARRYRYADVWRNRVRLIEENFYGPILRRDPVSPERDWGELVARDLFEPTFKLTRLQALRARFTRNYWALFVVLLGAWAVRLLTSPEPCGSWDELRQRLSSGPLLPWWLPLVYVGLCLTGMSVLLLVARPAPDAADVLRAESEHRSQPDL